MINLITEMRAEAKSTLEQSRAALQMRKKAGLISGIMVQIAAAKSLVKWYQRRNLSCKPARHLIAELQEQLNHHVGANQMLRSRIKDAADRDYKLGQALEIIQEQCDN